MSTLVRRFIIATLFIIFLPILFISGGQAYFFNKSLLRMQVDQATEKNREIVANIENEIADHSVLTASLIYDNEIETISSRYVDDSGSVSDKTLLSRELAQYVNRFFIYSNSIGVIAMQYHDGTTLYFGNSPQVRESLRRYLTARPNIDIPPGSLRISRLASLDERQENHFILSGMITPGKTSRVETVKAIFLCTRVPYIENLIRNTGAEGNADLLLYSREGDLILHTGNIVLPFDVEEYNAVADILKYPPEGDVISYTSRVIDSTGWHLVTVTDETDIIRKLSRYRLYSFISILFLLGLFILYLVLFSKRLAGPVTILLESMNVLGRMERPEPIDTIGIAELDVVFDRFNRMAEQIETLNREREERERQRLELEISALQLQINPHFMANTLNIIRFMAMAAKNQGIHDMIQALMRIVADSYAMKEPITTLRAEIENVRHYVYIMNMRFHGNVKLETAIDPALENSRVLRMMLQPIVENSVIHGFSGTLAKASIITISAAKEAGALTVIVADRGKGMDPIQAERVLQAEFTSPCRDKRFNPVGIKNVHDRIRLNFGEAYGLQIESAVGAGTTVRFNLPLTE